MAQMYNVISIVAFSIAGISFILTLFFLIKFHIPTLIGDLSGRTARKSIEEMRSENIKKKTNRTLIKVFASNETTLLSETAELSFDENVKFNLPQKHGKHRMIQNIILIHTNEVIE